MSDRKAPAMEKCISFSTQISQAWLVLERLLCLFTLIIEFKKVECPGPKNPTDVEYRNTCNIYRIYYLNINGCR